MGRKRPRGGDERVSMDAMIDVRHLRRQFGPILAVDDVSFTVAKGAVLGFLGPNGAGKSTTMKMITGFLAPTSGTAIVCGADIVADPITAKIHIGYLPEGAPCYPDMTPASFLRFIARIRGKDQEAIDLAVERTSLQTVMAQPIETLSKGFKRRVGLAQALLHDPDVLILDEPTDGLDPNQKHEVRTLINALAPQKAIIISTHLLEEVEAVCTRAIVIAQGRILADGTPGELEARSRHHNAVRLALVEERSDAAASLMRLPGVAEVETLEDDDGTALMIFARNGRPIVAEVTDLVRTAGWTVRELRLERGRLDDVFRAITTAKAA
jgi:ABC-2 type transport system ATP-binding protein